MANFLGHFQVQVKFALTINFYCIANIKYLINSF